MSEKFTARDYAGLAVAGGLGVTGLGLGGWLGLSFAHAVEDSMDVESVFTDIGFTGIGALALGYIFFALGARVGGRIVAGKWF